MPLKVVLKKKWSLKAGENQKMFCEAAIWAGHKAWEEIWEAGLLSGSFSGGEQEHKRWESTNFVQGMNSKLLLTDGHRSHMVPV